ncbi:GNAT family N-acetyltransferase [Rheinheimera baltica]|uniref:GNAT family N-acetyltransferase n=1 Tax=Rheinheimera baltica TaxID=67576 RepID=A0ABT9HUU6_9GAMM|nr:GNAT family N-acetyltransferase [Rheinheimera baltica]MDP5134461.1 GNAT family N-acetyltransferase [Rheinheimera baltica]MDP5141286.1 GNAT family N-acetyltransferase [Rheinheimera baltica]MDP5148515.1 GNAT family N-acetyltransferase [Rheinheimera baltica]MDP5190246.1 GNAT family N-acetyltransferase [Rheinheimera baltica]
MVVAETPRLRIRHLTAADVTFTCRLLNEPSFIENIADRGVRNELDAMHYLAEGPIKSYRQHGYGLFLVEECISGIPLGFCGLLRRDALQETDIGFAFMPQFCGQGYAFEAASAVIHFGYSTLKLKRIVGLTHAGNTASIKLLNRLGLQFEKMVKLTPSEDYIQLYA